MILNFPYNSTSSWSLLVWINNAVGFGGISLYDWIFYLATAVLGMSLVSYFMRNIYGTMRVASGSVMQGIFEGLNDPDAGVSVDAINREYGEDGDMDIIEVMRSRRSHWL